MKTPGNPSLDEQLAYYSARAEEYDEWWHRQGRYDQGDVENERWFREAAGVDAALGRFKPTGDVLELACGTGLRTRQLIPFADSVTAVDGSREMLAIHKFRVQSQKVTHVHANLFEWTPERRFDVVYFGFWLSHVPPDQFEWFWDLVREALKPGGRFFFVDSKRAMHSAARDHVHSTDNSCVQRRRLNDGREFEVYKILYEPTELKRRLGHLRWDCTVGETNTYFLYGYGGVSDS